MLVGSLVIIEEADHIIHLIQESAAEMSEAPTNTGAPLPPTPDPLEKAFTDANAVPPSPGENPLNSVFSENKGEQNSKENEKGGAGTFDLDALVQGPPIKLVRPSEDHKRWFDSAHHLMVLIFVRCRRRLLQLCCEN